MTLDTQPGTLEEDRLADIIIVSGNIHSDISVIAYPHNIKPVLKVGRAAKNMLEANVPVIAGQL